MPVRARVEERLVRKFVGGQAFYHGLVTTMPPEDYRAACEFAAEVYVSTVRAVDWDRLLIEATVLCAEKHKGGRCRGKRPCPDAIEEALLLLDRPIGDDAWAKARAAPAPKEPIDFVLPRELRGMFAAWLAARAKAMKATPLRRGERRKW